MENTTTVEAATPLSDSAYGNTTCVSYGTPPHNSTAEEQEQTPSYSVFVQEFTAPCTLIASTGDTYNTTVRECLERDSAIVQQRIETSNMPETNNYFRNSKWSPDGTCLLTNSEDTMIRLFHLPQNVYDQTATDDSEPVTVESMAPVLAIREGESIYDFAWFPMMNAQDPATFCFLTSVRDHPVRLWDATTQTVRASYCAIDHRERFIGPNVVRFNLEGSKIYCGYENMIEVFDVQRPGQESQKIPTVPKRKSKKGQKGIISCLDFSPDYAGLYAAGSYSKTVGIYDESNHELCLKLTGIEGGVTQVQFSPNGQCLYTASRQSQSILCWDLRNTVHILYELPRQGKTNQRLSFDMNAAGTVLVTGDQHGQVTFYNTHTGETTAQDPVDHSLMTLAAHQDSVSSASLNPVYPVMATTSGQRKYTMDSESEEDSVDLHTTDVHTMEKIDNSVHIWRMHGHYEWYHGP
ncbi:WD40-repeat-containing domain protein [Spinellus fusiger]|nr:WD40-repeat-containing domain protein [Spinellus fusiger]